MIGSVVTSISNTMIRHTGYLPGPARPARTRAASVASLLSTLHTRANLHDVP